MAEDKYHCNLHAVGADEVYRKLTDGIEDLPPEEAVDGLLLDAQVLRQGIVQLVDRILDTAEQKQTAVVQEYATQCKRATDLVQDALSEATLTGNYDTLETRLRDATQTMRTARESVSKMVIMQSTRSKYGTSIPEQDSNIETLWKIKEACEHPEKGNDFQSFFFSTKRNAAKLKRALESVGNPDERRKLLDAYKTVWCAYTQRKNGSARSIAI